MGQVVYTGSISGNHNLNANGSDGVTVYLSRSGEFPASYTVTGATLYLSKFYCYSRSYGIDLYLNGERVNNSEMCGSEVTQKESGGSTSWYSISGTWNLSTGADYEDVSAADIVTRAHSASSTGVMNLRDGCQVKITVEYSEGSGGGGGNTGGNDSGGTSGGGGYCAKAENVHLSATTSSGEDVILSWEYPGTLESLTSMVLHIEESTDGVTWKEKGWLGTELKDVAIVDGKTSPPILYAYAVQPPKTLWTYRRFRIRTCADNQQYSDYSETLQRARPSLVPYTDDPIAPRETHVKAVHMLELQTNVNKIREAEKLPAFEFAAIVSGRTGLAEWSAHVAELRSAIDEMGLEHEPWISFEINAPRADVIEQLRRVVAAL